MLTSIDEVISASLTAFTDLRKVNMNKSAMRTDIEAFVDSSLETAPELRRLRSRTKDEVRTTLIARSNGVYVLDTRCPRQLQRLPDANPFADFAGRNARLTG